MRSLERERERPYTESFYGCVPLRERGREGREEMQRAAGEWLRQAGSVKHGFRLVQRFPISEFDVVAYHLVHDRTSARWCHIEAEDSNNVFGTVFRTPVSDSSGLPHVLEHTVLCGKLVGLEGEQEGQEELFLTDTAQRRLGTLPCSRSVFQYDKAQFEHLYECADSSRLHHVPLFNAKQARLLQSYGCVP